MVEGKFISVRTAEVGRASAGLRVRPFSGWWWVRFEYMKNRTSGTRRGPETIRRE